MKRWMALVALLLAALVSVTVLPGEEPKSPADKPAADKDAPLSPEEQRERQVIDRFLSVLEKNPRRGTALDRVYGYHVERGSLEGLLARYRQRTEKDAKDGVAWLILGLVEAQRGKDAAAVTALKQAETTLPDNALAS